VSSNMDCKLILRSDQEGIVDGEFFWQSAHTDKMQRRFNQVIADVSRIYPNGVLIGAVAASKYIRYPIEPRITYDVDVIIDEVDFCRFLDDDIGEETLRLLDSYFEDSDSINHSLKHRETGIYVDLLSTESRPVRKRIIRYILENRDLTTNILRTGGNSIAILKPELIVAMKVNRYSKKPNSERGLADHLDIVKMLKSLWVGEITIDHSKVREFLNWHEIRKYESILGDVAQEMCT